MFTIAIFAVWVFAGAALTCGFAHIFSERSKRAQHAQCDPESFPSHLTTTKSCTTLTRPRLSAFTARRLTKTTFLIVETNDIYSEHPYIYGKVVRSANTILLIDTGCGGASNDKNVDITSLREFLETVALVDNGGRPLNHGARMKYVVVLTHCHYDHILGVEQFARDSPVLQSAHDLAFISAAKLPAHSHCQYLGVPTPRFHSIPTAHSASLVSPAGHPLGATLLHTPGHTPDEVAVWDANEGMLYVGDTLYEWEHIIFPTEGDIRTWLASVESLITLVEQSRSPATVLINCGHRTALRPALEVLQGTRQFMVDVLSGKEVVRNRFEKRDVVCVEYVQDGGRYSLICPERLILDAREVQTL